MLTLSERQQQHPDRSRDKYPEVFAGRTLQNTIQARFQILDIDTILEAVDGIGTERIIPMHGRERKRDDGTTASCADDHLNIVAVVKQRLKCEAKDLLVIYSGSSRVTSQNRLPSEASSRQDLRAPGSAHLPFDGEARFCPRRAGLVRPRTRKG